MYFVIHSFNHRLPKTSAEVLPNSFLRFLSFLKDKQIMVKWEKPLRILRTYTYSKSRVSPRELRAWAGARATDPVPTDLSRSVARSGHEIKFDMNLPGCPINIRDTHRVLMDGVIRVRNQARRQIKKSIEKMRGY